MDHTWKEPIRKRVACALACLTALTVGAVQAHEYQLILLDSVGGDVVINNAGAVAGALTQNGYAAGVFTNGKTTQLQGLGGYFTEVNAISQAGMSAGYSMLPDNSVYHATRWNNGSVTDLGTLTNQAGEVSVANGINAHGNVVGISGYLMANLHPVLWSEGSATALPTLAGGNGTGNAIAINDSNQIVGSVNVGPGHDHAVLWSGGALVDLGAAFEGDSGARDINDAGKIVGSASVFTELGWQVRPVEWIQASPTILGALDGLQSVPTAINAEGTIVGYSYGGFPYQSKATIWQGNQAFDLNSYLSAGVRQTGWVLMDAEDINDQGTIVGVANNARTGAWVSYILSPVPEPAPALQLGLGLLLGSLWLTKRKLKPATYSRKELLGARR